MKYLFFLLFVYTDSFSQKIELIAEKKGISFRGLSAVSEEVIWISGSKGTIGRSIDGGTTWQWIQPSGYESKDFRDIEAFDENTAIIIAVGEPALILKTEDGGKKWKAVFTDYTPGMFLDAMEFWNSESGIVIGDPINGRFFVARTFDGGNNWRSISHDKLPKADSGEACFAASGTNVRALTRGEACFITGGSKTRFFWKQVPVDIPIICGRETQGTNSVAVWFKGSKSPYIVAAGGDFNQPESKEKNFAISNNGGKTWSLPQTSPNGYRSCVEFITAEKVVTCGLNGVDISTDKGVNWKNISTVGYHVCRKSKKGKKVFLAGSGKIGKLVW